MLNVENSGYYGDICVKFQLFIKKVLLEEKYKEMFSKIVLNSYKFTIKNLICYLIFIISL